MTKGTIRHLFPGNNTSEGFFSFYQYLPPQPEKLTRYYIIKGGPGVGKSTFMRTIAETMVDMGYDAELHHCSSDNASLTSGFARPGVAVDGTAPHVIDPFPAQRKIINLGEFGTPPACKKTARKSWRRLPKLAASSAGLTAIWQQPRSFWTNMRAPSASRESWTGAP